MNCAACGKDNQPGTRFCVHCGAAIAGSRQVAGAPAPAAAPAPPSATVTRPAVAAPPPVDTTARTTSSPPPPPTPDDAPTRAVPAYGVEGPDASSGAAKVLLGLGIAALVIAAGFVGYKIFGGSADVKDSLARYDARTPTRQVVPAPVAPPPQDAPKAEEKAVIEPPEPPKPEPPKVDVAKAAADEKAKTPPQSKAEPKAPPKAPPAAATPAAPQVPPPVATPARPAAPVPQSPAPAAPAFDRWELMAAEQRHCRTENMFNRVICDQRVRLKFCDGYWGTVPQCPGAIINPDKGQ